MREIRCTEDLVDVGLGIKFPHTRNRVPVLQVLGNDSTRRLKPALAQRFIADFGGLGPFSFPHLSFGVLDAGSF